MSEAQRAPATGNRRLVALLGVAGGLLLMALVLPGLLFGGGDDDADDTVAPPPGAAPVTTTTLPPGEEPPETFEFFSTKNPFTPLVDTGGGTTTDGTSTDGGTTGGTSTGGTSTGGTSTGGTTTGGTSTGGTTTGGTATGGSTTGGTSTGGTEPRPMQRVALLEVFNDTDGEVVANVRVNDTVHKVSDGEQFATHYRVVSLDLDNGCAELLYGDDRFRICEGEELLK